MALGESHQAVTAWVAAARLYKKLGNSKGMATAMEQIGVNYVMLNCLKVSGCGVLFPASVSDVHSTHATGGRKELRRPCRSRARAWATAVALAARTGQCGCVAALAVPSGVVAAAAGAVRHRGKRG